jgi:flagellar motor protein MotB
MDDENVLEFNFWPAFSDLMLALVLILIVVMFLSNTILTISSGSLNLKTIEENQVKIIDSIANQYKTKPKELSKNVFGISTNNNNDYDIIIKNEPTIQRITFSNHILFLPDNYELNSEGQTALSNVGQVIKGQLNSIMEIQIQGHADTERTTLYKSNLQLASLRANQVFEFFQNSVGIDPVKYLMSATSFGEYKPVDRSNDDTDYNIDKLNAANDTTDKKDKNRRIEMLLFYKK